MKILKEGSEYYLEVSIEDVTVRPKLEIRGPVANQVLELIAKNHSGTVKNVSSDLDKQDSAVVQLILEDLDDLKMWIKMFTNPLPKTEIVKKIAILQAKYHSELMVGG